MNEWNRICLCNKPGCPWCKVWNEEKAKDAKEAAKSQILRTKFKAKK